MRSVLRITAVLAVGALAVSACSSGSSSGSSGASSGSGGAGASNITIAMVTHGDGGSFWSVAKKGAQDAAKAEGVTLDYQESNNDPAKQAQLIEAVDLWRRGELPGHRHR